MNRVEVATERLSWDGKGDIHSSYSADTIAGALSKGSTIRRPFKYEGKEYVAVGNVIGGGHDDTKAYRIVPVSQFQGKTKKYTDGNVNEGYESWRNDPMGFYHGMLVKRGKEEWVMTGPEIIFVPCAEIIEPKQLSLFTEKY